MVRCREVCRVGVCSALLFSVLIIAGTSSCQTTPSQEVEERGGSPRAEIESARNTESSSGEPTLKSPSPRSIAELLGGRLQAQLPLVEIREHGPTLPGKLLGCTEYVAKLQIGDVIITALDLGAIASDDLEADARAELKAWHLRNQVSEVEWTIEAFGRAKGPLKIVRATPSKLVGYLCGPGAGDNPISVVARFFVTHPDDTVIAIDFGVDEEETQRTEKVLSLAEEVMASVVPGPVSLVRTAGERVLPDIPPGEDLEIEVPHGTVVTASYGIDSSTIEMGQLRPMGKSLPMDLIAWSHSCDPVELESDRRRRQKGTLLGRPVEWLRGRERGRLFENILLEDERSGECTFITLWADDQGELRSLRASLEAGRRVSSCTDDDDCEDGSCFERRCRSGKSTL